MTYRTQITFDSPIGIIGNGKIQPQDINIISSHVSHFIAADGGANHFTPGKHPYLDAVIGDMDSIKHLEKWKKDPNCQTLKIKEQETTDFEKCLYSVSAPLFLGAGFLDSCLNHSLAALHVLLKYKHKTVVLVGAESLAFIPPLELNLVLEPKAVVSLFPLVPCKVLASSGLRWTVYELAADGDISTSNQAVTAEVSLLFDRIGAVMILERRFLGAVIAALYQPDEPTVKE